MLFSFAFCAAKRKPDITKAKTHLKWEPTVPLSEGLKRTIADFRARFEAGELMAGKPASAAAASSSSSSASAAAPAKKKK